MPSLAHAVLTAMGFGVALFVGPLPSRAHDVRNAVVEIVDHGTAAPDGLIWHEDAASLSGRRGEAGDVRRVATTAHVCAQHGTTFGVWYRATNAGPGATLPLEVVRRHPPITAPSGRTSRESTDPVSLHPGALAFSGWRFDDTERWGFVAGAWTIEIRQAGRTVASRTFTVTIGGCDLVS